MATLRENPYPGYGFLVEIDGLLDGTDARAGFSEVSGLGMEIDVIEYRAGNERTASGRKLPGLTRFSDVVLKRGVSGDLALFEWIAATASGSIRRAAVRITLLDEAREPVVAYRLTNAWPRTYRGPSLHAAGSRVAIEELVLCHEGLSIE